MNEILNKYFLLLYDSIHFPIQIINEDGNVVFVNKAFTFQWGYNIKELKEYSVFYDSELKHSGALAEIKNVFENKNFVFTENYSDSLLKAKEITLPLFRTKIFHISDGNENFVALFHEDQTEMILTEEEVKKARDGYKEAERLKNTFLNVLSHELRTPLNIVLGYTSIIKDSMKDKITAEDKIYLDNLYSGSERLFKSITQMLEFAQLEAGNYKVNIEPLELTTLIYNCLEGIRKTANEKKIDLKTQFRKKSVFVDADVQCVESAINSLLNNAVKFTRQGFIEIEVDTFEDRQLAICRVKDSGVGISTEYLDHLFRPFSQEDLNIGRFFEGNGLGLALSKRYIEKLGGSLLVDSIKGVGSTFSFTLPLSENLNKREQNLDQDSDKKIQNIFMLDDTNESYELLTAFLKNKFNITSKNFREFNIDDLNDKNFEFIIFDVNQNHWEQSILIVQDIKKHDKFNRPLVVISSVFSEERINEFYKAGANKFLVKPFNKSTLVDALEEISPKAIS